MPQKSYTKNESRYLLPLALLTLALGWVSPVWAQLVRGTVTSREGKLPGAAVVLKGTDRGTATDLNGDFSLQVDKDGAATLTISYTGYSPKDVDLTIAKGTNNIGTIYLIPDGGTLGDVVVKGSYVPSTIKALSIQKNANAIMNVIAADAIGKLPDRNAAEAVQRVQGVAVARYHGEADQATVRGAPFAWTSTLFNGNRLPSASASGTRASVLDAVPSEMIQYVQVSKAITPDMEGDAIGGSINFITRTAPLNRQLNVSLAGGYNNFSKDGTYNGSLVYGDRFFKGKLGVMLAAAIWDRNWGTDSYDITYNTGLSNPVQQKSINTFMMKRYMGKRQTYGSNLGLEYKINGNHRLFGRGLLDKFNDIRPVYESYIDFTNKRYQYNYRYSYYETMLNGAEIGGEHQLSSKVKIDWTVSDYISKFYIKTPNTVSDDRRGLPIATFRQKIDSGFTGLSSDGRKYHNFDSPDGTGDDPMHLMAHLKDPSQVMDPSKLTLQQLVLLRLDNSEEDRVAQMNVSWDLTPHLKLKAGGKFRNKQKEGINQASIVYLPGAALGIPNSPALVSLSQLERTDFPLRGGFFKELGSPYNAYIMDPLTKDQLFRLYDPAFLSKNGFRDMTSASYQTAFYNGHENVFSAYLMAEYQVSDKLKFVGGFRDEYTSLELNSSSARTVKENGSTRTIVEQTKATNNYNALLPMLHAKYSPNEKTNIRAAYTRTFVRPNFADLVPNETSDYTKAPVLITRGNPGLKPTFSNNFDLMGEYYFSNVGILSAGVFYKDLSNIIFTDRTTLSEDTVNMIISQPKNLQKGSLLGFEAGISRRLDFLKGFWSGFGVELNYSFIHSKVDVPRQVNGVTVTDKAQLPNQSKNLFNAVLFYERNGVMVRLAGNYRGKSIEAISQQLGPDLYTWSDKNFTVDASATVTLNKKIRVFAELNNLTNEPLRQYLGDPKRPTMVEWYGQRGQVGLRWDIIR